MQRSGTWFLLEHCVPWTQIRDMEAPLPGGSECEVITFLHVQVEPISEVRVELPAGMAATCWPARARLLQLPPARCREQWSRAS